MATKSNKRSEDVNSPRVFPIYIQTVELIVPQELDRFVHELIHAEHVGRQLFEGGRTERPTTDCEENLKI